MTSSRTTAPDRFAPLLRGGRLTKWKGRVASLSPTLGSFLDGTSTLSLDRARMADAGRAAAIVTLAGGAIIVSGSRAEAACTGGSGTYVCSGATTAGQILNAATLDVTLDPSFQLDTSTTSQNAIATTSTNGLILRQDAGSTVRGSYDGINASNAGAPIAITTNGSVVGDQVYGIAVRNSGATLELNALGTTTGGRTGVLSDNGPGAGSQIALAGTVSGSLYGLDARNATDALTITSSAVVSGAAAGIRASNQGDGPLTITTTGTVVSGSGAAIRAYNGGSGTVSVTTSGTVSSTGGFAIEVVNFGEATSVQSGAIDGFVGGIIVSSQGSGPTSIITSGVISTIGGTAIRADGGAEGTSLTIDVQDDIESGFSGIEATHYGSGPIAIETAGRVTAEYGSGISVIGSSNATTMTITARDDIDAGGYGISANHGGGALSIDAVGDITSQFKYGILASSSGTSIDIDARGTVSSSYGGISVTNTGTGATTVRAARTVAGGARTGIRAEAAGTGLTITSDEVVSGGTNGIDATNNGGTLTITALDAVTGGSEEGIFALNGSSGTTLTIDARGPVSGGTDGIFGRQLGSGELTITTSGPVTGDTGRGIRAESYGSALTVDARGDVTGAQDAISATNVGPGATTITTSGTVTSTTGAGLRIVGEANSAAMTVTTGGEIIGAGEGMVLTNRGSGATSINTMETVRGQSRYGMIATGFGASTTIDAGGNVYGGFGGILGIGRGSGALAITARGLVVGETGSGIIARGSDNVTSVMVQADRGVSGYYHGIYVSNYGIGATTVTASGAVTATSAEYNGITVYNGTDATSATVLARGAVSGGNDGIEVYNSGSGAISVTTLGAVTGAAGSGIYARNDPGSTSISIDARGTVSGVNGIDVGNQGSGGVDVRVSDDVTGTSAIGILAYNSANDVTGSMVITQAAGTTTTGGTDGINANNLGGSLTVEALGTTIGLGGDGIRAVNRATATSLTVVADDVTGAEYGVRVDNYGTGSTNVRITGDVTGADDNGVYVYGGETTASMTVVTEGTVIGDTNGGTDDAINIEHDGTGPLTVTILGNATGGGDGIDIEHDGPSSVTLAMAGRITGISDAGLEFETNDAATTATIVVTGAVTGAGEGMDVSHDGTGALDISVASAVTGGTGEAIRTRTDQSSTGNVGLTRIALNAGADMSSASGITITNDAGRSETIARSGSRVAGSISLGDGSDALTFDGGDFSAVTLFDGGDDLSGADGFVDVLSFRNVTGAVAGAAIANFEQVRMGSGTVLSFSDAALATGVAGEAGTGLFVDAGGTMQAFQNLGVAGNVTNAGTITMQDGRVGDVLDVTGDYEGQGGRLLFDIALDAQGSTADLMRVRGDATGTTEVLIKNVGGPIGRQNEIIRLVQVDGTTSPGAFQLANRGPLEFGAFVYQVEVEVPTTPPSPEPDTPATPGTPETPGEPGTPSVPGTPATPSIPETPGNPETPGTPGTPSVPGTPATPSTPATPGIPETPGTGSVPPPVLPPVPPGGGGVVVVTPTGQAGPSASTFESAPAILLGSFADLPTLRQRIDGRRSLDGSAGAGEAWLRFAGERVQTSPQETGTDAAFTTRTTEMQAGYDFAPVAAGEGQIVFGLTAHIGHVSADTGNRLGSGSIGADGFGIGATATYRDAGGFYTDVQARATRIDSDFAVKAGSLAKGERSTAYAFSLEAGRHISLDTRSALIPQAQLSVAYLDGGAFDDDRGNPVDLGSSGSTIGRVGLAYEFDATSIGVAASEARTVYAIANVLHDFSDARNVDFAGVSFEQRNRATWAEVGIGGSLSLDGGRTQIFGEASYRTNLSGRSNGSDDAFGLTAGLRVRF